MSYASVFFAVDIDELARVVADHDTSVIDRIKIASPQQFVQTLNDGDPSRGEALTHIIEGAPKDASHSHQYGYALQLLCKELGDWLPDDDLIADLEPLELDSPFEIDRIPIDIPDAPDFPFISFLTAAGVEQECARLALMDLTFPDDSDIEAARNAYSNCISEAAKRGLGIVYFYY